MSFFLVDTLCAGDAGVKLPVAPSGVRLRRQEHGTHPTHPGTVPSNIVTVTPATARFAALGATERLSAQVRDQHGQPMARATLAWTSSDPSVVSVDGEGLLTSVGNGSATVTATAGPVSGSATATVAQEVSAVAVSPDVEFLAEGDTARFTAKADDANGYPVTRAVFSWSSSDPGVAVIDDSGLVTAVGLGTAVIAATAGDGQGISEVSVVGGEWAILASFYRATNGAGWIENEGWLTDRPVGEWHGVTTGEGGRVTGLELPASNLVGPFPPELADLTGLEVLDLRRNLLTGPIPPELGNLPELKSLILGVNGLSGEIPPRLGDLVNLEILRLRRNRLSGPVPPELGGLSSLTRLGLDRNRLTGPVPSALLALDRLSSFHFADNESVCVAEAADYLEWLGGIDVYVGPLCNESDREVLMSLHESLGGMNWANSDGWLGDGVLGEWHGVEVDSLGRVTRLDLSRNGLEGRLPGSLLERLSRLVSLRLDGNADLSGPLPTSLSALSLQELHYGDTGLCVPANPSFNDWLGNIPSHEGTNVECPPLSDRDVLTLLHRKTGGTDWTDDANWLSDWPLCEWHGVETDDDGRVIALDLSQNRLMGQIPAELGSLSALHTLDLSQNYYLAGPIPATLGDLAALTTLNLSFNGLSGAIPIELGNASALETLELDYNGLTGPIPAELGNLSDLQLLSLSANDLTGPIPPELTMLSGLGRLYLSNNELTGPIPAELGHLSQLTSLGLDGNRLSGTIPTELGDLSNLYLLDLAENRLSGVLPPVLGALPRLTLLELGANALSGPIPAELGNLSNLQRLNLSRNSLTGTIPAELGSLARLRELNVRENRLTGALPHELGELSAIERLHLFNNPRMSGPLPQGLTALPELEELLVGGTDLCAPEDAGFQDWLGTLRLARVQRCGTMGGSRAYLTQAIQSLAHPVPLVADGPALLRVFVTASAATDTGIPPVRATFYIDGVETHAVDIPGSTTPIPTGIDEAESALGRSANAEIPGSIVQPGLEMVIEVDPRNTLDPGLGVTKRIPGTGRAAVRVESMPRLDVTFIPFLWALSADSSIVQLAEGMAADPQGHDMLWDTRTLMPVRDLAVTAHEPVLTTTTNVNALYAETALIRAIEEGTGHYMGIMPENVVGGDSGLAGLEGRVGFSVANGFVIAHELGHNMSLVHAPCGTAGDRTFPHVDGSIGGWGYDFRGEGELVSPAARDLMSYCGPPRWVSDYFFAEALHYRLATDGANAAFADARPGGDASGDQTIILWGGADAEGRPHLEPAFVADGSTALPPSPGEYELTGRSAAGRELFSVSFDMPEIADGDGSSSFVFALPVSDEWAGALESITLTGPGGSVAMDHATDRPVAILRDAESGHVRAILRDIDSVPVQAILRGGSPHGLAPKGVLAGLASGPELEVLRSRGIPDEGEWRRR